MSCMHIVVWMSCHTVFVGKKRKKEKGQLETLSVKFKSNSHMMAYMRVPENDIHTLTHMTATFEFTKTNPNTPREVAKVDIAMASFFPIRVSSAAPTTDPGRLVLGNFNQC